MKYKLREKKYEKTQKLEKQRNLKKLKWKQKNIF